MGIWTGLPYSPKPPGSPGLHHHHQQQRDPAWEMGGSPSGRAPSQDARGPLLTHGLPAARPPATGGGRARPRAPQVTCTDHAPPRGRSLGAPGHSEPGRVGLEAAGGSRFALLWDSSRPASSLPPFSPPALPPPSPASSCAPPRPPAAFPAPGHTRAGRFGTRDR